MKLKLLITIITSLILSSCAPRISNFHEYQKEHFPKTKFLPNKEDLKGKLPKVVIFDFDENENITAKQAKLGKSLAIYTQNALSQKKLAKLIDRKAAKKLEKEIVLAQINDSQVAYSGPKVADYAISGSISNAHFSKKYSSASMMIDHEGRFYKIPAKFTYKSKVTGNLKIYSIPSMDVVENFKISGFSKRTENIQKNNSISFGGLIEFGGQQEKGISRDDGLIRSAGENAINNTSILLKNAFARKGYILEKKIFKKKSIFKVNLGSNDKIKHGDRFEIFGEFEEVNPITNEIEVEKRKLATGRVSDIINPKYSWIVLDKKEDVTKIRLGDIVKFKYKARFLRKF